MAEAFEPVRAARLHEHGQPLAVEPATVESATDGELRVELRYAAINPVDGYVAAGLVAPDGPRPRTLGGEAVGTIDGRELLISGEGLGATRDGVWAGAAVVPASAVVELPDGVQPRDAAAMGIAGLTAWNAVHQLAHVTAEDRVLVLGASGGVGSMIVSLVHAEGATVWGQTGSSAKRERICEQGADRALVAGPEELAETIAELRPTAIFDPLGGGFAAPAVEALAPRGRIVTFGTSAGAQVTFNLQSLYRKAGSIIGYGGMQLGTDERRRGLQAALGALAAGKLRVVVDAVVPLAEVNEAMARLERREVQGKLLLDLRA